MTHKNGFRVDNNRGGKRVREAVGLAAIAAFAIAIPQSASAQENAAQQAMQAGEGEAAEAAWSNVLARDANNLAALIGRGTARGWLSDWEGAEADLARALTIAPDNLEALNAMGYVMAWSGRHAEAERYFNRLAQLAPDNRSAPNGLAYNALWAGENAEAEERFARIAYENPLDAEPMVGVGMARLAQGHAVGSADAHRDALERDPDSEDARRGLHAAYDYPALAELSIWGGDTSGGGDAGLRMVELASWVTPRTRIWARYDDGLTLDNPVLARSGANATTYSLGIHQEFAPGIIAIAEAGYRDLPAGENQEVFRLEGVYVSEVGASKIGAQLSPHSAGYTDRLFYASQSFNLGDNFRVEPSIYFGTTGAARDDEWRAVGYGEYSTGDWTLGLGAGLGQVSSVNPLAEGDIFTVFGNASVRVGGWHRLHLSVTHEDAPLSQFTRVLVGVTLRLPRN